MVKEGSLHPIQISNPTPVPTTTPTPTPTSTPTPSPSGMAYTTGTSCVPAECGDNICGPNICGPGEVCGCVESIASCPEDCCPKVGCGDGTCDTSVAICKETVSWCPNDCCPQPWPQTCFDHPDNVGCIGTCNVVS